jgi:hypothetical protein
LEHFELGVVGLHGRQSTLRRAFEAHALGAARALAWNVCFMHAISRKMKILARLTQAK